jgi:hypothetical protein
MSISRDQSSNTGPQIRVIVYLDNFPDTEYSERELAERGFHI